MNRTDFPFLDKNIYLDTAAGSLKPKQVAEAISDFYLNFPINPHSIDSIIGAKVAKKVNHVRDLVSKFVDATPDEVIFTGGTTDSLNRFALMIEDHLHENDEIVLSYSNHAGAIIPFIEIAKRIKAKIKVSDNPINDINEKTKLVIVPQISNSIQYKCEWKDIVLKARSVGALLVNDAAQALSHEKVTLNDADVIVFSGNKIYGPTGIGGLVIRSKLLNTLKPKTYGGGGTAKITNDLKWYPKGYIGDYEAGTPNTAGIIGLGAAIEYFNDAKHNGSLNNEHEVANYAYDRLTKLDNIIFYSTRGESSIHFNVKGVNAQDVVSTLGHKNIILRSGAHCAHLAHNLIDEPSSIRLSVGIYNTKDDIDKAIKIIEKGDFLDFI